MKEELKNIDLDNIFLFKVKDYSTILLGRFEDGKFFVQRGDGEVYEYDEYRIEWSQKLKCSIVKTPKKAIKEENLDECKCIRFAGGDKWYSNGCKIHPEG